MVGGEGCSRDRLYEQMDRQMESGQTGRCTEREVDSQTDEHATNRHRHEEKKNTNRQTDEKINSQTERQTYIWI